jgi:predicted amidophosphoribosyltransferase
MVFKCLFCKVQSFKPLRLCPDCHLRISPKWTQDLENRTVCLYRLDSLQYPILRIWKKHSYPNPFPRNGFFEAQAHALKVWLESSGATHLVPIPQHFERSLMCGRNPALEVAQYLLSLSPSLGLCSDLLIKRRGSRSIGQKAQLMGKGARLESPNSFKVNSEVLLSIGARPRFLIVDDFLTTGTTLRQAQEVLELFFPGSTVGAFVLGIRPDPTDSAKN